jgi:hypothetical protein
VQIGTFGFAGHDSQFFAKPEYPFFSTLGHTNN